MRFRQVMILPYRETGGDKTMDDSFFLRCGQRHNPYNRCANNKVYYKIVVKTESSLDRIESMPMDYILSEDTSKPPVRKTLQLFKENRWRGMWI